MDEPIAGSTLKTKKQSKGSSSMVYQTIYSIAFLHGISHLTLLAFDYLMKDDLKFSPSTKSLISSFMLVPFFLKPLFALVSDTYPFLGYYRKSYLILLAFLFFLGYLLLGFFNTYAFIAVSMIIIVRTAVAFSYTIGQALLVEEGRNKSVDGTNSLVASFLLLRNIIQFTSVLLGGYMLKYVSKSLLFIINSPFSLPTILFAWFLKEQRQRNTNPVDQRSSSLDYQHPSVINTQDIINPADLRVNSRSLDLSSSSRDNSEILSREQLLPGAIRPKRSTGISRAIQLLWNFLKLKFIYKYIILILCFFSLPSMIEPLFYFYTGKLKFNSIQMGYLKFAGGVMHILGVALYRYWLKNLGFKKLLYGITTTFFIFQFLGLMVVLRVNKLLGIPDFYFCIVNDSMFKMLHDLCLIPIVVICCQLCPRSIEGSTYSFFTAVENFGLFIGKQLGSLLMYLLGITAKNFDNLWVYIVIVKVLLIIPFIQIYFIDEEQANEFIGKTKQENRNDADL